ncbi:MATE family efflux transporter [Chlorella sorokiniana]|uniref:Protein DETOXIFICATION n=1 Tax=Chlorella sorokiniana TaxID=3076 RepID=A0A2P6TSV0_CHLSO|nr:MATE family efflux transporter [Chlorella sorokiniana]|eukprot:PRW57123.1 MATE family efflux transporter [Chlorella sorokiniana]
MSSPVVAASPRRRSSSGAESAPTTPAAAAASRRRFYHDAATQLGSGSVPLSSPYDFEISKLFAPALVAGLLEPVQMTAESICVGRLGVPQLGALGLGTVLFQFAVGFFAPLIIGTTPRVAAAHVESRHLASKATAQGMWVALLTGAALQAAVWAKTPDIVAYMSGSDVAVASFAVLYLRARSWGLPAALVMMVAIGAARGVKDLNIPLLGSLAYLIGLVAFDVLLLFGPPAMGMEGAGYAASAAQWVGAATVVALLARKQIFDVRDMASLPGPADVSPYARMTAPLAVNNLSALLPTLVATSLATGLGVTHLGAHTILRQLMGFWLQLFLAFNATAHSLVANNLSRRAEGRAAEVLARLAQLAVALSIPVAAALFLGRGLLPDLFTEDVLVRHEVADVLPLLLLIMPLDALGTVLEGGILGASDTGYLGARTAASCGISLVVLVLSFFLHGSLLSVWIGMKAINVTALALDLARFLRQPEPEGAAKQAGAPAAPAAKERQE